MNRYAPVLFLWKVLLADVKDQVCLQIIKRGYIFQYEMKKRKK